MTKQVSGKTLAVGIALTPAASALPLTGKVAMNSGIDSWVTCTGWWIFEAPTPASTVFCIVREQTVH
ncbi:hypothetical protein CA85_05090 [Allorhodopirellula solitaria]|uniref:Uncharacterized protein n=1 Tax=Allorhodopirellula solitaria TaxID=2527987 RepID=A0A5C5YJZ4_9BACT|nr:hypothetical protein CA85_05090 [Allorhodopirellula solitaria]